MTSDGNAAAKDELSLGPGKEELNSLLVMQFFEDSVRRYGINSEQARRLSKLLSPTYSMHLENDWLS